MNLSELGELDPDGDLTLVLVDRGDNGEAIVKHLHKIVILTREQSTSRAQGSLDSQLKDTKSTESWLGTRSSPSKSANRKARKIRLRVSSKHLTLASPVFKALLRGGFAESEHLNAGLPAEIQLPDDIAAAAFWLFLYVIH